MQSQCVVGFTLDQNSNLSLFHRVHLYACPTVVLCPCEDIESIYQDDTKAMPAYARY